LPQGAPTSPALSNLICRRLDRRLLGLATRLGFVYTRYADDLSFSGAKAKNVEALLRGVATIVTDEGFTVHPTKTRVMRKGRRMEVTGLVVNGEATIPRRTLRAFKALLYQIGRDGLEGKTWGESPATGADLLARIEGFARYVAMVHPQKGRAFLKEIAGLRERFGLPARPRPAPEFRRKSAAGQLPLPNQRVASAPPEPELADLIQHRDVEALVRERLGLPPLVTTEPGTKKKPEVRS
ncbi:MAG TPA: reverse transcriptase domain-containing protein, partial [Candidatus Obscuribacterales bacterium]